MKSVSSGKTRGSILIIEKKIKIKIKIKNM
jgi:hypothetical protein